MTQVTQALGKILFLVSKCQFKNLVEKCQCPVKATSEIPLKHLFRSANDEELEGTQLTLNTAKG